MTQAIHQRLARRRLAPSEHAVDAGYVSAGHILAAPDDHGITLLGPVGADTTQASRGVGQEPALPQAAFSIHWGRTAGHLPPRSLTLLSREQHELLARQRAEQQTAEWKARYNIRADVEGTIFQVVRATRLRRTPYHGQDKTHLASVLSATAINLIRADAWLNGTPLGTTRVSHLARLDLAA